MSTAEAIRQRTTMMFTISAGILAVDKTAVGSLIVTLNWLCSSIPVFDCDARLPATMKLKKHKKTWMADSQTV